MHIANHIVPDDVSIKKYINTYDYERGRRFIDMKLDTISFDESEDDSSEAEELDEEEL